MFIPMLIAAFILTGQSVQTLECGNLITKTSETWPDWAGGKVSLTVHTEDDQWRHGDRLTCVLGLSSAIRKQGSEQDLPWPGVLLTASAEDQASQGWQRPLPLGGRGY